MEQFHSYKDLARRFGKCAYTMRRWFGKQKGVLRPSHATVLIPESVVQKFIHDKSKAVKNSKR